MMIIKSIWICAAAFLLLGATSCKKFLDKKIRQDLTLISSVEELQALLDNTNYLNDAGAAAGENSSDDYYLTDQFLSSLNLMLRNQYLWSNGPFFSPTGNEWSNLYGRIYTTNVVLYHLDKINRSANDQVKWNNVKGHALLVRAFNYIRALGIWTLAYNPNSANEQLGLPLRLDPDFEKKSVRASLGETYELVVHDLKEAVQLLPITPIHVLRPSVAAAHALLARTYLMMRMYDSAKVHAGLCLSTRDELFDFNDLPGTLPAYPFSPRFSNPEIIMDFSLSPSTNLQPANCKVDTFLYRSFQDDDIRKKAFFLINTDSSVRFRGSYEGSNILFDGVATDEMYLIRAECNARTGDIENALADLNTLLEKRFLSGTYTPFESTDQPEVLDKILEERRKELLFRNLRFIDIKRLNMEGRAITPARFFENQLILLEPNSNKYALPIPDQVIDQTGMPQNPR